MQCACGKLQRLSLPTQQTTFIPECAATHTRNTIGEKLVSLRKKLDVHDCFVYAVKHKTAMINRAIIADSVSGV